MLSFLNRQYPFSDGLTYNLKVVLGTTLGMFLFLLFFQPIGFTHSDFDTRLLLLTGYSGIICLLLALFRILIPSISPGVFSDETWNLSLEVVLNFLTWAFISVAITFYARYVGLVEITFFLVVKIVLISLMPVAIVIIVNEYSRIRHSLVVLLTAQDQEQHGHSGDTTVHSESDSLILFPSETKSEIFRVPVDQILLIKSANNYIEVIWKANDRINRQLIRTTLSKTEKIIKKHSCLVRCHRTIIINVKHVGSLTNGPKGFQIRLNGYTDSIPVSRQYLIQVRQALYAGKG